MNSFLSTLFLLGLLSSASSASSVLGPLKITILNPDKPSPIDSFVEHKISVENSSSQTLHLIIKREESHIPAGWNVSMCLDLCLPDFIKSEKWSIPADSQKVMSIDIQASSIAEAKLELQFINEANDSLLESIPLSYASSESVTPLIHHSNNSIISFKQGFMGSYVDFPNFSQFDYKIINAMGQEIISFKNQKASPLEPYLIQTQKLKPTPHILIISTKNQIFNIPFTPFK